MYPFRVFWWAVLLCVLLASAAWPEQAQLLWEYTQGGTVATQFAVYRQDGSGAMVRIATLPVSQLTYIDQTLVQGRQYTWQVTALAEGGEESTPSNSVSFRVPMLPPAGPRNLRIQQP